MIMQIDFEKSSAPLQAFALKGTAVEQIQGSELGLPEDEILDALDIEDPGVVEMCCACGIGVIRYQHGEGIDIREELEQLLTVYYQPLLDE